MQNSQLKAGEKQEYIHCYLCGKDTYKTIITSHARIASASTSFTSSDEKSNNIFKLVECNNCGLHYINPRPAKQHMGYYYSEGYYAHNPVKKKKQKERKHFTEKWKNKKNNVRELVRIYYYNYPCNTGEDRKSLSSYKKILLWFFYLTYRSRLDVIPFTGEGKLLDIGCGNGRYLSTMRKLGWRTSGVEKSPKASRYAREELHLDVNTGDLLDYKYHDKSFDAVTMWHSLEHLYEPFQTLKEIGRMLNNDGLLVVAVPNIDSFVAKVFKTYWYGLQLPIHLIAFTPDSITKMLKSAGFDVQKIYYDRRGSTLRLSLLNLKDGKYRFLSRLSSFKGAIKMLNFILAKFGSCDIIVIHSRKKTSYDV